MCTGRAGHNIYIFGFLTFNECAQNKFQKLQKRMFFLRKQNRIDSCILQMFYKALFQSILAFVFICAFAYLYISTQIFYPFIHTCLSCFCFFYVYILSLFASCNALTFAVLTSCVQRQFDKQLLDEETRSHIFLDSDPSG